MKNNDAYHYHNVKVVLFIGIIFLALVGCKETRHTNAVSESKQHIPEVLVKVKKLEPRPIKDILVLPGQTLPWEDIVVPAETGGKIEWVGAKEGDLVKKGQLIARIDIQAIEAALEKAKASFELVDYIYKRRKKLYDQKILDKEQLDRALTQRNLALASLKQAQVDHDKGFVRSPIIGMINRRFVDPGEFVNRGDPVAQLVNVDKIKVEVQVPELDIPFIRAGESTLVKIDALPEKSISGRIDFVSFEADPATKTFLARIIIENPKHEIRPGMIARVAFLKRIVPNAIVVPLFCIIDRGGERIVFVEEDGIAHARTVSIGVIDRDNVQITSGLKAGENLIVVGQRDLEEGMKVRVQ